MPYAKDSVMVEKSNGMIYQNKVRNRIGKRDAKTGKLLKCDKRIRFMKS